MPRSRILVGCTVLVVLALLGFAVEALWVTPPPPSAGPTGEPAAAAQLAGTRPDATEPPEAPRTPLSAEEQALAQSRARTFENFGVRRIGATRGGLRVTVVQGGVPLVGAFVQLVPIQRTFGDEKAWIEVVRDGRPVAARARTDTEGQVQFDGEHPHGALVWAMHGDTMAWRTTGPVVWKRVECQIELGRAIVRGTVHDAEGRPRKGAVLTAAAPEVVKGTRAQVPEQFVAVSDAQGRFTIEGLPAAAVTITCLGGEGMLDEQRLVDTARHPEARVRFGAEPGSRWWRGRVVDALGRAQRGGTPLCFEEVDGAERRRCQAAFDGSFAVRLSPGRWRGFVAHDLLVHPQPAVLQLTDADVELDLRDDRGRVLCRLAPATATVSLHAVDRQVRLDRDGSYYAHPIVLQHGEATWLLWRGLPPGVYHLLASGTLKCVGEPAGGHQFDLTGEPGTAEMDVVVR
ncbi:MAG: carboxypeptidase regulatory-like domain-containing protein [Planctomycetes bacterium]|nr:carboxypeptidase regulatory-like domain-containing protein [Planctomycetota bacterium]